MADIDFVRKLKGELKAWISEGIIAPEQEERILSRYRVLEEAEEKAGSSKLITVISVMGSILIGVGVILFIAANWSMIPRAGKLAIIFLSLFATYAAGWYLRYEKKTFPKVGASLILLGTIIYGAGIFLIAQIYNISVHYPNGPLMWGLGVLPLAYLLKFRSILLLSLLDLLLWMGMETSFRMEGHDSFFSFFALYLAAGLMLWALGLAHRKFEPTKGLAGPYIVLGVLSVFIPGYAFTFEVDRWRLGSPGLAVFYAVIAAVFVVSMIVFLLPWNREKGWIAEAAGLSGLMALVCFWIIPGLLVPQGMSDYYPHEESHSIIANLIYAAMIVGIIVLGYIKRYNAYINIGILFFVLDVIARYFDFFWNLLPRSIFFIAGGIMLLAGGIFLEKKRRKVLRSFRLSEDMP